MAHNVLSLRFERLGLVDEHVKLADYIDFIESNSANKFSPFKFNVAVKNKSLSYYDVILSTESIYRFKFSFVVLPCIFVFSYWFVIPYLMLAMFDLTQSRFGLYGLFWLGMRKRGLRLSPKILSNNEIIFKYL